MKRKRLVWQIFPSFLLVTLIAIVTAIWFASHAMEIFFLDQTATDLKDRIALVRYQIEPLFQLIQPERIDRICKDAGQVSSTRFTIILPDGTVVGDSQENPDHMDNHAGRPEISAAISHGSGQSVRYSKTLDRRLMYVAVAVNVQGHLAGVVRAAFPVTSLETKMRAIRWRMAGGGLLIAVLVGLISLLAARKISHPIEMLKQGADNFAAGNLAHKLALPDTEELAGLATAMNTMATRLDNRIVTAISQKNELETVLSSMREGVVAIDTGEAIMSMNPLAAEMFECDRERAKNLSMQEVVRNLALQTFVTKALKAEDSLEDDIAFYRRAEIILNIKSSPIVDATGQRIGTLLVMTDVTRLRRLEHMRRDFVANVSHEIKTPLTAIKGYVETIYNREVDSPEDTHRFLGIVIKHVNRLESIVEDLLSLSRIERENFREALNLSAVRLGDIFQTVIQVCQNNAEAKRIDIQIKRGEDLRVTVDVTLLEQAILNLLDNAIKYSKKGSQVEIRAEKQDGLIAIHIRDYGGGIAKRNLSRLFERFYRVDKARSRQLGGTGLGLAIVKHIVQAHEGDIKVESKLGEGSTFSIYLP
jgi:two-component system, OmpR family, phosphate regulon sensor histidine kinase PhoR